MVDIGNSILKTLNDINLPSLPLSTLYATFVLFGLVLDSRLMNITDYVLWNVKDFTLT